MNCTIDRNEVIIHTRDYDFPSHSSRDDDDDDDDDPKSCFKLPKNRVCYSI